MSRFDHSDIDGRLLQVLLAVFEEQSVTRAAARLDVTQSAVSHLLDKLREIVGDPLFVKSGRGIVATARAEALAAHARVLLDGLRNFAAAGRFDPATFEGPLTIAANDLQRDLLLPLLLRTARVRAPGLALRIIPSDVPEAGDILQKRLFEDRYLVYFDAGQRDAPRGLDDYLASEHCSVHYAARRTLDIDEWIAAQGHRRRFAVTVPGFAGIGPFLRGSTRLATLPGLLRANLLRGLAVAPPPFDCPPMPMYMVWHLRHHADPMHQWLREELQAVVAPALAAAELRPRVA